MTGKSFLCGGALRPNLLATATLVADSSTPNNPVSNLATQQGAEVWRALGTSAGFTADFQATKTLRWIALALTNLTATATVRLRLSNVAAGRGEVLDTRITGTGRLTTEAGEFITTESGDRLVLDDGGFQNVPMNVGLRRQWGYALEEALSARYMRIDIDDSANADGFLQFGFGWAGDALELSLMPVNGMQLGMDDLSTGTATIGGQTLLDERPDIWVLTCQWDYLEDAEIYDDVLTFLASASKQNAYIVPYPASPYVNTQAMHGLIQKSKRVANVTFIYHGLPIEIRERL